VNDKFLETFRALVSSRIAELEQADVLGEAGQATVTLDQQSVGRLNRMDALQNQAMAKASHARRQGEHQRLAAALVRIDEGEFGYCKDCGDNIAPGRLELDPAVELCIQCARG